MSVLLLDPWSLIFAGWWRGLSASSPLSTSPELTDACDRLPCEEWVLPTDLLLNRNLGKYSQHVMNIMNITARIISIVPTVPKLLLLYTASISWGLTELFISSSSSITTSPSNVLGFSNQGNCYDLLWVTTKVFCKHCHIGIIENERKNKEQKLKLVKPKDH